MEREMLHPFMLSHVLMVGQQHGCVFWPLKELLPFLKRSFD